MADYPDPGFLPTVPVLTRRFSAEFGEAEAIVGNGSRITFAGLAAQSAAAAKSLIGVGACKGARVGILVPPGPEFRQAGLDVVRLNVDSAGLSRDGRFLGSRLHELVGRPVHYPAARIAHGFGMTETLGAHTSLKFGELLPGDRPRWQGRPVPGVEAQIVDPVSGRPLAPGELGELRIRGYCLMLGFDGRERHETFDADGFYSTGDLCILDEQGLLKFESRIGEMIKIHGANVAPLEVEQALTGLAGIEKAAVVGILGHDVDLLVAAVVMARGRVFDEAVVRANLKTTLSSFKVPRRIIGLDWATMPLSGSGGV